MNKAIPILLLTLLAIACNRERDEYYQRPDWLQGPLYEQIKSTGAYEEYINVVDYIGYEDFLSSRLTFTAFVPTNEAFEEYYSELGVGSYQDIDMEHLQAVIEYHLLEHPWDSVKMARKSSWGYWGGTPENFRTPCYYAPPIELQEGKNVYFDKTYLHLFSVPLFQYHGFPASDYETFYPQSEYTGYNINRASIVEDQLGAENGFYYVIDKVMVPKTTADREIEKNPDFSVFYDLMKIFLQYKYNSSASDKNKNYDSLFSRTFSLNVDLANEKITDSDPDGYYHVLNTVFIPQNQVIIDYFNDNFPAYGGLDHVPNIIIKYFVEAQLVLNKKLFPSVLAKTENETNDFSDEIDYEIGNGIVSQQFASNAIIYGVDRALNTNAFSTVSGPIIKNPDYRIFTMMLELSDEIKTFFKREIGHVAFVLSDDFLTDMGYNYYEGDPVDFTDDRIFLNNDELSNTELKEFLKDYISITYKDLEGADEIYIKTKNNNYLKVSENFVDGVFGQASVLNSYSASNGIVLEIDTTLLTTTTYTMEDYLNENKTTYSSFFNLCSIAGLVSAEGEIDKKLSLFTGVTLLLPTNDAVNAVLGSYLPASPSKEEARDLIKYQIISERAIFTDDSFPSNAYGTDLFLNSIRMKITTGADNNTVTITDNLGNSYQFGPASDKNIIASNGIIHIVDQVALY